MAIIGCKDRRTERFLEGRRVPDFEAITDAATRALTKLQAATVPADLLAPPSNRFEALHGDRSNTYSIRINAQYRLCFKWAPHEPILPGRDPMLAQGDAYDVEIVDYH